MNNIFFKIEMSSRDLINFTDYIQFNEYGDNMFIIDIRKRNLDIILDENNRDVYSHKLSFNNFSKIDNFPIMEIDNDVEIGIIKFKNFEIINFIFKDTDEINLLILEIFPKKY